MDRPTFRNDSDGYWRARWRDGHGVRRARSFGRDPARAALGFADWLARWNADPAVRDPSDPSALSIDAAAARFRVHAAAHYRDASGRPTGEAANFDQALAELVDRFGGTRPTEFTPTEFRAIRSAWIRDGLAVTTVNARARRIRAVFRWWVSEGIAPAGVLARLAAIAPVRPGTARTPDPVVPVPDAALAAVLAVVPAELGDLVRFQVTTGARPGEAIRLRPIDLDTASTPWAYTPPEHKTAHRGTTRRIFLGPAARAILEPRLAIPIGARVFRPRGRVGYTADGYTAGGYTVDGYRAAIRRACLRAGVVVWSPHQLRHNAATRFRSAFDLDLARAALGQRSLAVADNYGAIDQAAVRRAIEKVG